MSDNTIQQVRDRLDIVEVVSSYIKLDKAGANLRACCPFHSEKKPSFFVSPSRQIFKCFGCGQGGGIFDFVMKIEGIEFGDALRMLAQKAGVEIKSFNPELKTKRDNSLDICELSSRFFEIQLAKSANGKLAESYLFSRGLKAETMRKWRLGYAPDAWRGLFDFLVSKGFRKDEIISSGVAVESLKTSTPFDRFRNRIMFPVFDLNSQVIGFGGRIFDKITGKTQAKDEGIAKYVNISNTLLYDKSKVLYGLNFAKVALHQKNFCILTEGYMDVILSHQAGFENTVSSSGTSLTPFQLKIIKRYTPNILSAFDMDFAGGVATNRGIELAQREDFNVKVICMPKDKDPADIISVSPQDWQELISKARDAMGFYFESAFSRFNKNDIQGKREIANFLLPLIKRIPNKIVLSHWLQELSQDLKIPESALAEEMKKVPEMSFSLPDKSPGNFNQPNQNIKVQAIDNAVSAQTKTRQQLLEERVIALLFKDYRVVALLEQEKLTCFSSSIECLLKKVIEKKPENQEQLQVVLKELEKTDQNLSDFLSSIEFLDDLTFKDTNLNFLNNDNAHIEEELKLCLMHLGRLSLRHKLDELTSEINSAEKSSDSQRLKGLMTEFYELSKNFLTTQI